jgi:hypothetical protein
VDRPPLVVACRAYGREDVLDMQRGIMTLERLRRNWRRCAECQSGDIEIAASSGGHRPDAERLHRIWRRCVACLSCDLEIAAAEAAKVG